MTELKNEFDLNELKNKFTIIKINLISSTEDNVILFDGNKKLFKFINYIEENKLFDQIKLKHNIENKSIEIDVIYSLYFNILCYYYYYTKDKQIYLREKFNLYLCEIHQLTFNLIKESINYLSGFLYYQDLQIICNTVYKLLIRNTKIFTNFISENESNLLNILILFCEYASKNDFNKLIIKAQLYDIDNNVIKWLNHYLKYMKAPNFGEKYNKLFNIN